MFVIPCKYSHTSPIRACVDGIRNNYPHEKIILVDSASNDTEYITSINCYDVIYGNMNYEIGAYLKAFEKYPDEEWYHNIHDSLIVKSIIPKEYYDNGVFSIQWFNGFWDSESQMDWAKTNIDIVKDFIGCFGSMFIANNKNMKLIYEKCRNMKLPETKLQSCAMERVLGIIIQENLKIDIKNSLQGMHTIQADVYDKKYVEKIFCGRT